jgi:hypothetical protein
MDFNIEILKQAHKELSEDSTDLVRVASIVRKVKNWWKAIWSPEFREKQLVVEKTFDDVKEPLTNLISNLRELENAFSSQDPEAVARLVSETPTLITGVTSGLGDLNKSMRAVDRIIPTSYVDQDGHVVWREDVTRVQQGYKSNSAIIRKLQEQLNPLVRKIPISGSINANVQDFEWFRTYSPNDVVISSGMIRVLRIKVVEALHRRLNIPLDECQDLFDQNVNELVKNLKSAVLEGMLISYDFPEITKKVKNAPVNQMLMTVNCGDIPFTDNIYISFPEVRLRDLGASRASNKELSMAGIASIRPYRSKEEPEDHPEEAESPDLDIDVDVDEEPKELNFDESNTYDREVLASKLPLSTFVVSVQGPKNHFNVKFAKVLCSALRQEIQSEVCAIHYDGDVEVEVPILGSKKAAQNAVLGVTSMIADEFYQKTGTSVEFSVQAGKSRKPQAKPSLIEHSFRKVSIEMMNKGK